MKTYIKATLVDGTTVVSEFSKMGTGFGYMHQVAAGRPFNAWRTVAGAHPASGEVLNIRELVVIPSARIVSLNVCNADGSMVVTVPRGECGRYRFPTENVPEGGAAGIDYPIRRDPVTLRRYVVLDAASNVIHNLDAAPVVSDEAQTDDDGELESEDA